MAIFLCLEDFNSNVGGQDWRFQSGELIDDSIYGAAVIANLKTQGLAILPYTAGSMAAPVAAFLADHSRDDDRPSFIPWLQAFDALTADAALVTTAAKAQLGATATVEDALDFLNDGEYDAGSVACFQIIQAGLPVAAETITIGADVYTAIAPGVPAAFEFVVAAGDAAATFVNLFNAIVANGTEDLLFDQLDATHIRGRSADGPQGTVIGASPNILLAAAPMTNYVFDCGEVNLNTLGGRAAGQQRIVSADIPVNAGHITSGELRLSFSAAVTEAIVAFYTSTGVAHAIGTDTWVIDNGDILVTLAGGGAPSLIAGDVIRVIAAL